jgi:hypothetical protein
MGITIFELAFINKLWREQEATSFGSRERRDVIFNRSIIDNIIRINNKCIPRIDIVIVNICGDNDWGANYQRVLYIKKTLSDWPVTSYIAIEIKVIFRRFVPFQI